MKVMTYGIKLWVGGSRACFTRPEMKAERVSYDVITPSAARGLIEAIHWKPAIRWVVDKIHVLKPIRFESIRRNEVGSKIPTAGANGVSAAMKSGSIAKLFLDVADPDNRAQRASTILKDVAYVIEAHFELTHKAGDDDTEAKHLEMFKRRADKGQCFHQPCLGTREFPAEFSLIEGDPPASQLPPDQRNKELGWMLYDIDFDNDRLPMFYRPTMVEGVIDVAKFRPKEARS
jgi:CRISPR-associated protein Cas5d